MKAKEEILDSATVMANYSKKLHKYAQEIKTGDYINCALVLSATNKKTRIALYCPRFIALPRLNICKSL